MSENEKSIFDEAFRKAMTEALTKIIIFILIGWVGLAVMAFKSFYSIEKRITLVELTLDRQIEQQRVINSIHNKLEILIQEKKEKERDE